MCKAIFTNFHTTPQVASEICLFLATLLDWHFGTKARADVDAAWAQWIRNRHGRRRGRRDAGAPAAGRGRRRLAVTNARRVGNLMSGTISAMREVTEKAAGSSLWLRFIASSYFEVRSASLAMTRWPGQPRFAASRRYAAVQRAAANTTVQIISRPMLRGDCETLVDSSPMPIRAARSIAD
jgi:hypothetical protein